MATKKPWSFEPDVEDPFLDSPTRSETLAKRRTLLVETQIQQLEGLEVEDLLALRQAVDAALPATTLKDVDLAKELVIQLQVVKQLQADVMKDDEIPANQRAQCAGQVGTVLVALAKLQNDTFDSERLKVVEGILIETVRALPTEQQEAFLTAYAVALGGVK